MARVCLLGRHGSGKSTIGASLTLHGYQHTSVGMLRRLAQAGEFPSDVPASLMFAMRRERAGMPMSSNTARKLVDHAMRDHNAILDGFPSSVEHLSLLPEATIFCVVWAPKSLRLERLEQRAQTSKRLWTPGVHSAREASLPSLIWALRQSRKTIFVANCSGREDAVNRFLEKVAAT